MGSARKIPQIPKIPVASGKVELPPRKGLNGRFLFKKYLGGGEGYPARVLEKGQKMQRITNIYLLIDTSLYMKANVEKVRSILARTERALAFIPQKTKLHIWGYNDEARLIEANDRIITHGNPNLAEGLKAIKNAVLYERKYSPQIYNLQFLWTVAFAQVAFNTICRISCFFKFFVVMPFKTCHTIAF